MSKRLIYTRPDGGISVVDVASDTRMLLPRKNAEPVPEPEEFWLQRMAKLVIPADAQDVRVVEATDIPADRTFRDAWRHRNGIIGIDMPHARDLHRNRLRAAREPLLKKLDVAYQRAHEQNDADQIKAVVTAKQVLRDATAHPGIDAAQTPEELKAVWPLDA